MSRRHVQKKSYTGKVIIAGIAAAIAIGIAYAAASGAFSSIEAPRAPDAAHRQPIAMHDHAQLTIMIEGSKVTIPADVGIRPNLWADRSLDQYGMQTPAMAPLHTHGTDGIIHIESTVIRNFTVGEFFDIWGVTFTSTCIMDKCNDGTKSVKMFVNGEPNFEFRNYAMRDGDDILIRYD